MPTKIETKTFGKRAQEIYDKYLKRELEPQHKGEFVAIDIDFK